MTESKKGTLLVVLSAISFGLMPLVVTKVYAYGCSPATMLYFRQLLPIPLFVWLSRRDFGKTFRERGRPLTAAALFSGVLTPLLLMSSYLYIPSGMATTLHFIYPMFVFLIGILALRQPFCVKKLLCYALCAAGVYLLQASGHGGGPVGIALALASGVTYAIYIVVIDRARLGGYNPFAVNAVILAVSHVGVLLYGLATRSMTLALPVRAYALIVLLAFLIGISGSLFFQVGVAKIGGQRAALLSCFEPITSVLCGALFLHEGLTPRFAAGTVIIIAAITASVMLDSKKAPVKAKETA